MGCERGWGDSGAASAGSLVSSWNHLGSICGLPPLHVSTATGILEAAKCISNPQIYTEEWLEEPVSNAQKKPFHSLGAKVVFLWFRRTRGYSSPPWK